jgi:hypothetical protein
MKKIATIISLMSAGITANAQTVFDPFTNEQAFFEMMHSVVIIILVFLASSFVLTLIKLFLDDRLKRTIVEKGVAEGVIAQLLPANQKGKENSLKWFAILTAIAIGLTVISFYMPSGLYAATVMIFSIALGFLGYYFLLKKLR